MKHTLPLVLLALSPFAYADSNPLGTLADLPKTLLCELHDMRAPRVVDQVAIPIQPTEPGVLMLSYGSIIAYVRDFPAADGLRNIEMKMKYSAYGTDGEASSTATYSTVIPATSDPIAQMQVEEPVWGRSIRLMCYALAEPAGSNALDPAPDKAGTPTYVTGSGSASGSCDGSFGGGSFCMDDIKRRANDDAARSADLSCRVRGGTADTLFPSCSNFCSPFSIPPGAGLTFVSCSSNCSIRCDLP